VYGAGLDENEDWGRRSGDEKKEKQPKIGDSAGIGQ